MNGIVGLSREGRAASDHVPEEPGSRKLHGEVRFVPAEVDLECQGWLGDPGQCVRVGAIVRGMRAEAALGGIAQRRSVGRMRVPPCGVFFDRVGDFQGSLDAESQENRDKQE